MRKWKSPEEGQAVLAARNVIHGPSSDQCRRLLWKENLKIHDYMVSRDGRGQNCYDMYGGYFVQYFK
ncbi:MAG: hypothetical protein ACLU8D_12835 [Enterocloster sp.]